MTAAADFPGVLRGVREVFEDAKRCATLHRCTRGPPGQTSVRCGAPVRPKLQRRDDRLELGDHVAVEAHDRLAVIGRGALGDDRDLAAGGERDLRELGDGIDLERGADAQQEVGVGGQR